MNADILGRWTAAALGNSAVAEPLPKLILFAFICVHLRFRFKGERRHG
jgi:hypothetical protein